MAKDKKKKKVNIPDKMVDYYAVYAIDRNLDTKEIRKLLLKKQGEIRSNMANGSLNSEEIANKLQEAFNDVANAIKVFKNEERRKEYDTMLDAAYEAGKIDVEAQKIAQDIYEEIEALFLKGDYRRAVQKCIETLNQGVKDYRIYVLLAQSYFAMNEVDRSLGTVEDGLNVHPNNIPLLKVGARYANEGKKDYDKAQKYVNRIFEVDSDSADAAAEQSYIYLSMGKEDMAYEQIDRYVEKHPNDMEFRKNVAYDLIGYSYNNCYTKDPESDAYVIASEEDYQKSLNLCNKASGLYSDSNTNTAYENAKSYGQVEFNDENREGIFWLKVAGGIYLFIGIIFLMQTLSVGEGFLNVLPMLLFGILCIHAAIKLKKVSYRPYWQINKFILTGKREKGEGRYVWIGKIFAGYIKWSFKFSWWLFRLILCFI
jgi:tetratricopeptide (TPR) repeat protein